GSTLLPLGALAAIGWVIVWAARRYVGASGATTLQRKALEGAKLGVPLSVLCFLAAVIFRLRGEEVAADPVLALLLGGLWGAVFGAIGGVTTEGRVTDLITGRLPGLSIASSRALRGLMAGETMLVTGAILAFAGLLAYLIVALAAGSGVQPTPGEALALLIVLAIFAPNLASGALAFSLGAPNLFVARSFGVGLEREVSLLGWGDAHPAPLLYLALLIPLIACGLGGYVARYRTERPEEPFAVLSVAVATFAIVLAVVVYLGRLDYSAGVLGEGSLVVLRASSGAALLLGMLWAVVAGYIGWKVAEAREQQGRRVPRNGSL
ncbi:MAG TPA: hypothetical protein VE889_04290, partial [Actinomycetota bacterium]|nr:hypothetical protein [Actinomycetota bacterium]